MTHAFWRNRRKRENNYINMYLLIRDIFLGMHQAKSLELKRKLSLLFLIFF